MTWAKMHFELNEQQLLDGIMMLSSCHDNHQGYTMWKGVFDNER